MKKQILAFLLLCGSSSVAMAQEKASAADLSASYEDNTTSIRPEDGRLSIGLLLGNSRSLPSINVPTSSTTPNAIKPVTPTFGENNGNNSLINMTGIELRYFLSSQFSVGLVAGAQFSTNPAKNDIPGVNAESDAPGSVVPSNGTVDKRSNTTIFTSLQGTYHIEVENPRISPFIGLQGVFSRNEKKFERTTPTLRPGQGIDDIGSPGHLEYTKEDAGLRKASVMGFGGNLTAGADYYLAKGFYLGIQVNALSYTYAKSSINVSQGTESAKASAQNFEFISLPTLRLGFTF